MGVGLNLGSSTALDLIQQRGEALQKEFMASKTLNFHDSYVLGEKLGEG
jgi:hypothetical protein